MDNLEEIFYDDTIQLVNEYNDKIIEQLQAKMVVHIVPNYDTFVYVVFDVHLPYDFTRDTIISIHKKAGLTFIQTMIDGHIMIEWKGFKIVFSRE